MLNRLRVAMVAVLLLAAGEAAALGLGRIEVKSRLNQPLLAEIPIISNDPSELAELRARMASPDTFRRVGLQPPQGVAADLHFSLGRDARGRPVIRVTSVAPVDQAVLNFLIEVDWGQGRLVREYSALVDVPNTAGATLPPPVSAPAMAAPNLVQRPEAAVAEAVPAAPEPTPEPVPAAEPAADPAPAPDEVAVAPPAEAAPEPVAAEASGDGIGEYGPVKRGETLSKIAGVLGLEGFSLNQTMLGLLRANPDAFLGENVNRLRQGSVLRVPGSEEIGSVAADEAELVVREQMRQWRQSRRPVPQPQAVAAADAGGRGDAAGTGRGAQPEPAAAPEPAPKTAPKSARSAAAGTASGQQARLEILPPSADGKAAGTSSGVSAGGEGKMLQQQLQQRDEDIAAKSAEIGELKNRVAELEDLQSKQQQLLSMKDSELATARQALEQARKAQAAAPTSTVQPAPPAQADDAGGSLWPWLWGGLGLLAVAALAFLFARRGGAKPLGHKPAAKTEPRRGFDSAALAAAVPKAAPESSPAGAVGSETDQPGDAPGWHAGGRSPTPAASTATAGSVPVHEADEASRHEPHPVSTEQRLKLVRAFIDIGDDSSARQLLREMLVDEDPAARSEASKLLRDLGN